MQEMTFFIAGCLIHAGSRRRLGGLLASPNRRRRILLSVFALFGLLLATVPASADTPVSLYESLAGNINITGTGGTLRTNPDGVNSCSVTNNGSMTLSGIPAGATVRKAYLYWAGSGGDPVGGVPADYNVTFNGTPVTADRTFTANGGSTRYFFGGVKEVTSQVTGNGIYTFADLTVQTADVPGGGPYCSVAVVLSAFSLVVVYDDPAETLHVVNLWEGFQVYYGSSIMLTPTNFIVPTPAPVTALSSRILVLTWEGDSGNSAPLGGFTENLTFCSPTPCAGTALTDAYNPLNNQFNSTVDIPPSGPFSGINTTWGNDLDMYDLTARLPAGAASAQSVYSSGGDRVILMNQTMSIVNVPVADLAITKSHVGDFTVGVNGVYTLGGITNNGPNSATGTITVTDTLPAGLTYSSATGTGWACGAVGQTVTCTRPGPLANGATAPDITLTVSVAAAAFPSVNNTVSITSADFDNVAGNSTNVSDPTTVLRPDLSTSTKTWVDQNGGDQNPNDVIQYTITIIESGGALVSGVSVTDTLPATLTSPSVVSCPGTAVCGFAGQTLTATNISVPASGSVTIVFNATIAGSTPIGTLINNTATIANPFGPGATADAPTIIVSGSSVPQAGNKPLYLYSAASYTLSRTPTPGIPAAVTIARGGNSQTWTELPVLQLPVTIDSAVNPTVPVQLWLATNNNRAYPVDVRLACSSAPGAFLSQQQNIGLNGTPTLFTFNLSAQPSPTFTTMNCAAGNSWQLTIINNMGAGGGARNVLVYPVDPGSGAISQAILPSQNVINVDTVAIYNAAYPGGSPLATAPSGTTVYVRSVISDPFGSFDITSAGIIITDPTGSVRVNGAAMTDQVSATTPSTRTYEYSYTIPAAGPAGNWTFRVDGIEGTEGTVSDFGVTALSVYIPMPNLLVVKSVTTISDPFNLGVNPKAIPGAIMEYTVQASNEGNGAADNNSLSVIDRIPTNTAMYVNDIGGVGSGPVLFTDGPTFGALASGLTYAYASLNDAFDGLAFSNDGGVTFNYTPVVPDVNGCDTNITHVRVSLNGAFTFSASAPRPSFRLKFRIRVK